jgi:hypothetical protein
MTDQTAKQEIKDRIQIAGVFAVILVPLAILLFWPDLSRRAMVNTDNLEKCETVIQARLKAPSTYKRISEDMCEGPTCLIEYDAMNSFGVPLRSKGYCSIDQRTGAADWMEFGTGD